MITRKDAFGSESFQGYINEAPDDDLMISLQENTKRFRKLLKKIPRKKIDYAYTDGKWTIREMLQHIIDAERVFAYRAIWFARKDPSPLPGFEENDWAVNSKAKERKWKDLINEFEFLRASSIYLFSSFDEEQLRNEGTANNNKCNVAALGFVIAGHVEHHMKVIREKYLSYRDLKI
jgi:uncharacterized damage-inducible protein DinB